MGKVIVNGLSLNVTDIPAIPGQRFGAGQTPIVMIHGLAASSAFWYLAGAPNLAMFGPVLLYDLRGHGKSETPPSGYGVGSMADDLGALLDARGIERAHLVAHSFGGMIALLYALRHPERVESLALIDVRVRPLQGSLSFTRPEIKPGVARRLAALGIDVTEMSKSDDGIDYLKSVARIQIAAESDADEILGALYNHPRLFGSRRNAERWIKFVENASLVSDLAEEMTFGPQDLRRLTHPMLIMPGEKSPTVQSARALARLCPAAVLRVVPGVGHFYPMSSPELFLRPTARFLRAVNRQNGGLLRRAAAISARRAGLTGALDS